MRMKGSKHSEDLSEIEAVRHCNLLCTESKERVTFSSLHSYMFLHFIGKHRERFMKKDSEFKVSCKPWALKNWCFWTVVLEKTLESPLNCKEIQPVHPKGNQSWVFIGRTDAKAKPQYFGHLMQRVDSLEKTLMLGGIGGRRRGWDDWKASLTRWMWVWVNSGSWWWTGRPGVLRFMGSQRVGQDWATELNWTETLREYIVWKVYTCSECRVK